MGSGRAPSAITLTSPLPIIPTPILPPPSTTPSPPGMISSPSPASPAPPPLTTCAALGTTSRTTLTISMTPPPTSLEDALHKMKETLRKNKETLRKLKEKHNWKDVDSESDSSNFDIDPEIEKILAERFNKKPKSEVPVETESLSRASPNLNPLHELRGCDPANSDNTSSEALQEVAIESKRLSDETIASFRLSKFKSGSSSRSKKLSDNCTLCQSAIRKGEYLITLPCKHYFHKEYITRWLKMNKVCCMCRYEVEDN